MARTSKRTVSKLEAARCQLETAINLYFHEGDQISIHTLACAAHEIVQSINRGKGDKPTLKDSLKQNIKPAFVKVFYKKMNEAQNFFKHSGRDEHQSIEFAPYFSDVLLLDACWTYRRITNQRLPMLGTFEMWAAITWGKEFVKYPGLDLADPLLVEHANLTRQEFLAALLPVAHGALVTVPSTK